MDLGTIAGFILAALCLVTAIFCTPGASVRALIDFPSLLVVFGGGLAAAMIAFPFRVFQQLPNVLARVIWNQPIDRQAVIEKLVSLGETARRRGLLSVEKRIAEIDIPLIRLGLQMLVDGTRPEIVQDLLRAEIDALSARHREGRSFIEQMGRYAPAFGLVGTLLGLILMLGRMTDPAAIGSGMAVALTTTLYGALAANLVLLPCAEKLKYLHTQEVLVLEMAVRGILAIAAGESPRVIEQRLRVFHLSGETPVARREAA